MTLHSLLLAFSSCLSSSFAFSAGIALPGSRFYEQLATLDDSCQRCAGWKESQKVFTDALAQMVTADSSAYSDAEEAAQHVHMQPGSRRLLATAPHSTGSAHASAQQAPDAILERPGLTDVTQHSTAGSAGSAGSAGPVLNSDAQKVVVQGTADSAHTAQEVNSASMSSEGLQEPQLDKGDQQANTGHTCSADSEVSTVCADRHQPVLAPQPWEQEEEGSGQRLRLQQCQLLNASVCEPSVQMSKQGQGFMVVVYNALAWERPTEPIRVPLDTTADAQWVVTGQCSELTTNFSICNLTWQVQLMLHDESHIAALMLHWKQNDSGQLANDVWLACRQQRH